MRRSASRTFVAGAIRAPENQKFSGGNPPRSPRFKANDSLIEEYQS
jgi:hypothetical protein